MAQLSDSHEQQMSSTPWLHCPRDLHLVPIANPIDLVVKIALKQLKRFSNMNALLAQRAARERRRHRSQLAMRSDYSKV
jgi:hypothetical protein